MLRRYAFALASLLLLLLSTNAPAQSTDRTRLLAEIADLREHLKIKEQEFLGPSPEDRASFAEFLRQPETGLIRLMPRDEKYRKQLPTNGGGAYYSFSRLTHEYGYGSDLSLEQEHFSVGFAGASFGYILMLGDAPLEEVAAETDGVQFLAALSSPSKEPDARAQQHHAHKGVNHGNFAYRARVPMKVGATYVVRSVSYNDADTLVAFRVVRQDTDGSVILLWKMLKKFSKPQLID